MGMSLYNGSTITRVPLDVLSTELSMAKKIAAILLCGNLFLRIAKKKTKKLDPAKI